MLFYEGNSANEVWCNISKTFLEIDTPMQKSRIGLTKELLHVGLTIHNPRQRWVLSRIPAMNPAFAIAEVVWIMNGRDEANFLNFWNSQLPQYAGYENQYHGAYGFRLRKCFEFDQLKRAFDTLKNNPESRQVVLQIWNPKIDFPDNLGSPVSSDIPCNICSMLKIRNNKLEWMQIMRSNDLYLGTPYNFIQFTCLQEIIAGWLEIEMGSYNQISDSLHIYEKQFHYLNTASNVTEETNTDNLALNYTESKIVWSEIYSLILNMTSTNLSPSKMLSMILTKQFPEGFQNILFILLAELARRNNNDEIITEAIANCTNKYLKQVWENWERRFKKIT